MYHSTSSPRNVTFTLRGIIGTEERTFRDWVTHKYTKSHGRLANTNKAAAPRTGARGSGADPQKLHHAHRVAAAERRASVPDQNFLFAHCCSSEEQIRDITASNQKQH